jgi:hypothetical protein
MSALARSALPACGWLIPVLLTLVTAPLAAQQGTDQDAGDQGAAADPLLLRLSDLVSPFSADADAPQPIQTGLLSNPGESRFFDVTVEPGACYTLAAVGEDSLDDLDLHLYGEGVELASDTKVDNTPVVQWCNLAQLARVSAELRAYSGSGRFAFEVLHHSGQPAGFEGTLWAALEAAVAQYASGLRPAAPPWQDVLPEAGEDSLDTDLLAGHTYVVVGAGAPTVTDLDLVLLDPSGAEVDADLRPDATPVLRYAVPAGGSGTYRIRVIATAGFGPVGLRILSD